MIVYTLYITQRSEITLCALVILFRKKKGVMLMLVNATFNNISPILCRPLLYYIHNMLCRIHIAMSEMRTHILSGYRHWLHDHDHHHPDRRQIWKQITYWRKIVWDFKHRIIRFIMDLKRDTIKHYYLTVQGVYSCIVKRKF